MSAQAVVELLQDVDDGYTHAYFWCPGCDSPHALRVGGPKDGHGWSFNGDVLRPTFAPSLLVNGRTPRHERTTPRCHSYITDGQIRFLGDSEHELAGQTVPLPPWPWPEEAHG